MAAPAGAFQVCGACRTPWPSWDAFIADPGIRLLGLQAVLTHADASLLVFEHRCGSSVSILTRRLRHLLPRDGSEAWTSLRFTDACPGHCYSVRDHLQCDQHCLHARDRRLLELIEGLAAARVAAGAAAPAAANEHATAMKP